MELLISNGITSNIVFIIDDYFSLIWTTRYFTYGDFELTLPFSIKYLLSLKLGQIITRTDSDYSMMIEKIATETDSENGDRIIVSGRSAEVLLNYRIIAEQFNFSGTVEDCIREAVKRNCISPADNTRKLPILLGSSKSFSDKCDIQVSYENLGDWISEVCRNNGYGWHLKNNGTAGFQFEIYSGLNITETVQFSEEYGNLINSNYYNDVTDFRNVAFVGGEGEGTDRRVFEYENTATAASGTNRREIFVDARDLSSNNGTISDLGYQMKSADRGFEELGNHIAVNEFSVTVDNTTYKFKEDYNLGDIVKVVTNYCTADARIIEIIESDGEEGYSLVPTLEIIKTEE